METDLAPGTQLPEQEHRPETEDLVRYAAAANDFARIHYDGDHARSRGFDGVIVHGLLKAAYLGQLVTRWAVEVGGTVRSFTTTYRRVDRPGEPLMCCGRVANIERREHVVIAHVELWTEDAAARRTTLGTAEVELPTAT